MRLKGQRPALICKSGHRISWLGARDETPRARRTDALALISTARRIPVLVGNDPVAYPGREEVWDSRPSKSFSMGWDERRPSDDCCERLVDWLHRVIFPRNKCKAQWVRHALPSCRSLPRWHSPCLPARACPCPTARSIMSSTYIPHHAPTYFLRYLGRAGVDGDRLAKHLRARRGPTHPRAPSAEDNASLV